MNRYNNFVKPSALCVEVKPRYFLSGEEAKQIYLQEISKGRQTVQTPTTSSKDSKSKVQIKPCDDKELRLAVQNNQADIVRNMLQINPEKIDLLDDFGWSLLMIACQANAEDSVKVLLDNNANTSIQDKAGNSARSLVIQNKYVNLAHLFLTEQESNKEIKEKSKCFKKRKHKSEFSCEICDNKVFTDQKEHLSSTIHNINASKGVKPKSCYKIPMSNRGYQIMLKNGWDRDNGLGRDGCGHKYPIRTIQKLDKKGLGLEKLKAKKTEELTQLNSSLKPTKPDHYKSRRMEINFRREFY